MNDSDPNLATNRPGNVPRATIKQIYQTLTKDHHPLDKNGDPISFSPPNHQPEHLYAKEPRPEFQAKEPRPDCKTKQAQQAQIDTLRITLTGMIASNVARVSVHMPAYMEAVSALRETKP
jgi:hypothetical protein